MFIQVTKAVYLQQYKIYLEFNDGSKGVANLEGKLKGPVFEPHRDIEFFKRFKLVSPTIEWPNKTDLAPEFLYDLTVKETETV